MRYRARSAVMPGGWKAERRGGRALLATRHRGQWLRVPQAPSTNAAEYVAGTRPGVRHDGDCAMPGGPPRIWTRPIFALDRRRGPCDLSLGLFDRRAVLSNSRCFLTRTVS